METEAGEQEKNKLISDRKTLSSSCAFDVFDIARSAISSMKRRKLEPELSAGREGIKHPCRISCLSLRWKPSSHVHQELPGADFDRVGQGSQSEDPFRE